MSRFHLLDVMNELTATLPYGKQRLLEIAVAIATKPRVLLLDEPAAGVPESERHDILAAVAALPRAGTVLLIEHDMDLEFSFADAIWVLVNGARLVEGPRLKERRSNFGNQLSGGKQQMLAIGRALTLNPKVLLLDEPTEGLAPIIVDELLKALGTITRAGGICSIIVEQNAQKILGLADRVVILERGAIVHDAASSTLKADPAVLERYLGVSGAAAH